MDHIIQASPSSRQLANSSQAGSANVQSYSGGRYGLEGAEDEDSRSTLMEYWRILRRHSRAITIASMAGLLVGFCVGIPMKPVYRAHTSLEVLTLNEDFMNMKQSSPTTVSSNDDASEEQTQAKLLTSSTVINRVISKLDNNSTRPQAKTRIAKTGWRSILHLSEPVPLSQRQMMLSKTGSTVKVTPTTHTRVLELTVDSTDPKLAMDFANTLTEEFMAANLEARWKTTQMTSEWLRRELEEARDKLRHSEDSLQTYARNSGLIFTDETTNVATEKLQQIQQALSIATTDRITHQSRYELAQHSPSESLADVLNDPLLRDMQSKMNDLKRQIADLSAIFSPEYSKIERLNAELDSLKSAFEHSKTDILSRIKNDFQESDRREKLLAGTYNAQARDVNGQDEKAIQYNILKRDVDSNRQLYDTMLQQMKQASIASAMRSSNVRVVDMADLPASAVFPNFILNSALGLVGGFLLSVALISVRNHADRSLQQPGDIKMWLDLPELGVIPTASQEVRRSIYGYTPRSAAAIQSPAPALALPSKGAKTLALGSSESVELITFQKKPSVVAEAFRSALTSILFVGEGNTRPCVLAFTSANAGEGKTTVASNLAIAAAEIRCKVLIIDADLRRPRMHQIFGVANERGLTNFLEDEFSHERLSELVQRTNIPNLDVLTAGPATHAAAHLLYSPNFVGLLDKFREDYNMIFIDTPPMLQITDARVAGRLADAVILVARAGRTTRDAVLAAKARLAEDQIRILGMVLNDWNPKMSPGGYYGYYGGTYQSAYTSSK